MCLIIHKPNAELNIDEFILDNAEEINPDGFGIVFTDTNEVVYTMDYEEARKLIQLSRPFVAHYRYATRGKINATNCHPYPVTKDIHLFSNGTVADLGDDNVCDTKLVADMLKRIPSKHWADVLSMTETRFAITSDSEVQRHGTWHERNGIFYSKNNCFHKYKSVIGYNYNNNHYTNTHSTKYWYDKPVEEDAWEVDDRKYTTEYHYGSMYEWEHVNLVAVYGTLKAGRGNHGLLSKSNYVGAGETIYKYPMQAQGIPFVFDKAGTGSQIPVEVYELLDDDTKDDLDLLEGHPTNYERKLIDVEMLDGAVKSCWLYFANPAYEQSTMEYIQTY